jgi:hypothetical protein
MKKMMLLLGLFVSSISLQAKIFSCYSEGYGQGYIHYDAWRGHDRCYVDGKAHDITRNYDV